MQNSEDTAGELPNPRKSIVPEKINEESEGEQSGRDGN